MGKPSAVEEKRYGVRRTETAMKIVLLYHFLGRWGVEVLLPGEETRLAQSARFSRQKLNMVTPLPYVPVGDQRSLVRRPRPARLRLAVYRSN